MQKEKLTWCYFTWVARQAELEPPRNLVMCRSWADCDFSAAKLDKLIRLLTSGLPEKHELT